jgi:hypothetical protein
MVNFPDYITKYPNLPDDVPGTPPEIVKGFKVFMDYYKKLCLSNSGREPNTAQYIAEWNRRHNPDNRAITYLTIGQLRQIIREETKG